MRERPILFSGAMVRALLDGTKTQTRRVVKPEPKHPLFAKRHMLALDDEGCDLYLHSSTLARAIRCPYGKPGDRLWVRETFEKIEGQTQPWIETDYRATYTHGDRMGDHLGLKKRWTPAIHMPRAASRITLEVTSVRVERLGEISEADARAEGFELGAPPCTDAPLRWYRNLWESINGPGSWAANPWVWVIEFRRAA